MTVLFQFPVSQTLSVALETNGKAYIGFIVELPGAFVRGRSEEEALSKVGLEARSYFSWLGTQDVVPQGTRVVQRHHCGLMVEDADCEILSDADRGNMAEEEFRSLTDLVGYSGKTFLRLFDKSELKDWVDPARIRKTFYGDNKKTIREIFHHVKRTQYYYLSRTRIPFEEKEEGEFGHIREFCLANIRHIYGKDGNSRLFEVDNEAWTLKKILRRFIWHDRIHGKAISRILEKQKQFGLIPEYDNPFCFEMAQLSGQR